VLVLENDLTELTGGVWESFLGMPAEPTAPVAPGEGSYYTSWVHISGGWEGAVNLVLPEALARDAAAAMFGTTPDALTADELTDAVGELANIIGGNIKGMIDDPCTLSLPMVASGQRYSVAVPGTELVRSATLVAAGQTFTVAVHARRT
jgi:chemotaxis protein CheX